MKMTSLLVECLAYHQEAINKNLEEVLHATWSELCFLYPSLQLFTMGYQARFSVEVNQHSFAMHDRAAPKLSY